MRRSAHMRTTDVDRPWGMAEVLQPSRLRMPLDVRVHHISPRTVIHRSAQLPLGWDHAAPVAIAPGRLQARN